MHLEEPLHPTLASIRDLQSHGLLHLSHALCPVSPTANYCAPGTITHRGPDIPSQSIPVSGRRLVFHFYLMGVLSCALYWSVLVSIPCLLHLETPRRATRGRPFQRMAWVGRIKCNRYRESRWHSSPWEYHLLSPPPNPQSSTPAYPSQTLSDPLAPCSDDLAFIIHKAQKLQAAEYNGRWGYKPALGYTTGSLVITA